MKDGSLQLDVTAEGERPVEPLGETLDDLGVDVAEAALVDAGALDLDRHVLADRPEWAIDQRLDELGPPQKTRQLNRRGRTLKINLDLLVIQVH